MQWSMLNDEAYTRFAVLAVVEPHLYADRSTGEVRCGNCNGWTPLTPTVQREHGHGQFAYRAMLWVSTTIQAVQIPVSSHDVAVAMISTSGGTVLVISACAPTREIAALRNARRSIGTRSASVRPWKKHNRDLAERSRSRSVPTSMVTIVRGRKGGDSKAKKDRGTAIVHLAQQFGLRSMLPAGTITWQHVGKAQCSTAGMQESGG